MLVDSLAAILIVSTILVTARLFYIWGWNAGKLNNEYLSKQKYLFDEIDRLRDAVKDNRPDR